MFFSIIFFNISVISLSHKKLIFSIPYSIKYSQLYAPESLGKSTFTQYSPPIKKGLSEVTVPSSLVFGSVSFAPFTILSNAAFILDEVKQVIFRP